MAITSSTPFPDGHAQPGGFRYVRELHTSDDNRVFEPFYLATDGADYQATANARALKIAEQMAEWEYHETIKRVAALNLKWNTTATFAARMREDYRSKKQDQLCMVAWWVVEMINAGFVTDAQVRNAFGMTVDQYNSFKANKMVPAHDSWVVVLSAEGE